MSSSSSALGVRDTMGTAINIGAYLERIGYRGPLSREASTLRDLHVAHMRCVPYENLSIMACQAVDLDEAALYEKIVIGQRGGFCYELNILFAGLLHELGFSVRRIAARIAKPDGS